MGRSCWPNKNRNDLPSCEHPICKGYGTDRCVLLHCFECGADRAQEIFVGTRIVDWEQAAQDVFDELERHGLLAPGACKQAGDGVHKAKLAEWNGDQLE